MKPGFEQVKFAENDDYPAGGGAWNANPCKVIPGAQHIQTGWHPGDQPSTAILNHLLHRMGIMQREIARMKAANWVAQTDWGGLGGSEIDGYSYDEFNDLHSLIVYNPATFIATVYYISTNETWILDAIACTVGTAIAGADIASDDAGRRIAICEASTPHAQGVRYSTTPATWVSITNAVDKSWSCLGCDRDTYGNGYATWLFGDNPGGGSAPVLYYSTNGTSMHNLAGFPTLAVGRTIRGIFHTLHRAGTLAPSGSGTGQDPGNPYWLVLTDVEAIRSSSGTVWLQANHGIPGGLSKRQAAYSKTSARWVVIEANSGGAIDGDVWYSDDNGATWTRIATALPIGAAPGSTPQVVCDGYGTFVATDGVDMFISTDEGMTWTRFRGQDDIALDEFVLGVSIDSTATINDAQDKSSSFHYLIHNSTGPFAYLWRSLRS